MIVGVDAGHERWHQHHAEVELGTALDHGAVSASSRSRPRKLPMNLIARAIELQKHGR